MEPIDCRLQEARDEVRVDLGGDVCVALPQDVLDVVGQKSKPTPIMTVIEHPDDDRVVALRS